MLTLIGENIGPQIPRNNVVFIPNRLPNLFARRPEMTCPIPSKIGLIDEDVGHEKLCRRAVRHFVFFRHRCDLLFDWALYLPQSGLLQVNDYEFSLNDIEITLFDTPGLADGTGKEEEYLRKIREKVTGPCDVFIFCTEMNATRFRTDDVKTLETLTKTFGPPLWEHALVALTFANNVHPPKNAGVTEIEYFDDRMLMFKKAITDVILKAGVPEKVVTNLPFVATGDLWTLSLPGITDWKEVFWIETFKSLNKSAQLPFYFSNCDRMKFSSSSAEKQHYPCSIV